MLLLVGSHSLQLLEHGVTRPSRPITPPTAALRQMMAELASRVHDLQFGGQAMSPLAV